MREVSHERTRLSPQPPIDIRGHRFRYTLVNHM